MKTLWMALMVAAAGVARTHHSDIVVYVHHGSESAAVVGTAERQAERMLSAVGLSVEWRLGTPRYQENCEVIEAVLLDRAADDFQPGALAFATLGAQAGTRIEVFYNRVLASGPASDVPSILAHVLVHEITHILEGMKRHSETGVMKAHWTPEDFLAMRSANLGFAPEDARLIKAWVACHSRTLVAAAR